MEVRVLGFMNLNLRINRKSGIIQSLRLFPQPPVFQGNKIVDEGKLFFTEKIRATE